MQEFTARLTGNLRETHTACPKLLLVDIRYTDGTLFRDHCWINLSTNIDNIRPKRGRNKPKKVRFSATEKEYIKSSLKYDTTLHKIHNITVVS